MKTRKQIKKVKYAKFISYLEDRLGIDTVAVLYTDFLINDNNA